MQLCGFWVVYLASRPCLRPSRLHVTCIFISPSDAVKVDSGANIHSIKAALQAELELTYLNNLIASTLRM